MKPGQLPKPECKYGYPEAQLAAILTEDEYNRLGLWIRGQTMSVCDGREYDHNEREYHDTGCGPHGPVVYGHDLRNFLEGGRPLD